MSSGYTILVVEDETVIRTGLCDALAHHGHVALGVGSGRDGLAQGLGGRHALVLLDVMLLDVSGFDVCRGLRAQRPLQAIMMLTARGSEADVLEGFRCGADDYVTKPFSVAELLARVDALLRRAAATPASTAEPFQFGPWRVDPIARAAVSQSGTVPLTAREVELLALFTRERGRIVGRRQLLAEVWGMQHVDDIETRTVDMHIAKLRKKIAVAAQDTIETIRGEGYRFGS